MAWPCSCSRRTPTAAWKCSSWTATRSSSTCTLSIEYGVRISEVAQNIMESVKFAVEKALGLPVVQVNVHVQGLHVSNAD